MEVVMSGSGSTCLLVGFDHFRKLLPVSADGCALHDQTMTISVFTERPV
jgi:hypothetical protein